MQFHMNLGLVLCVFVSTVCSKCAHDEERLPWERVKVVCWNVTSSIDLDYDGKTNVEELVIPNSKIKLLPSNSSLSRFGRLKLLNMTGLGIEELAPGAFSGLKNLNYLYLNWNNISILPVGVFNELQSLKHLDLTHNQISVLEENSFSGLTNLSSLQLPYNKLGVVNDKTFHSLKGLTGLDISGNQLTEIQNYELPGLEYFLVGDNNLKEFNVNLSQTHLIGINVSNCNLSVVDFALFPKDLSFLDLSYNHINSLVNFDKLSAEHVYLDHNELTEIEIYPQEVNVLYLNNNKIKTLKNSQNYSHIRDLYLNYNEIVEINSESFLGLEKLRVLELKFNKIESLNRETFQSLKNLKALELQFNDFKHIDPNAFTDLHNLEFLLISNATYNSLNSSSIPNETMVYSYGKDKELVKIKCFECF